MKNLFILFFLILAPQLHAGPKCFILFKKLKAESKVWEVKFFKEKQMRVSMWVYKKNPKAESTLEDQATLEDINETCVKYGHFNIYKGIKNGMPESTCLVQRHRGAPFMECWDARKMNGVMRSEVKGKIWELKK